MGVRVLLRRYTLALVALTFLCITAKPSYGLALVPSLGLLVAYSFVRPLKINRALLIGAVIIPAALLLAWQYLFWYGPARDSHIYIAPLQLLAAWQVPWTLILPELLLSIAFPLAVYLLYFPQARQSLTFNLAWLVFFAGAAYMYVFVEIPKQANGNFTWSSQITLLILFVVATGFILRQRLNVQKPGLDWRFWLCAAIFLLHLLNHLLVLIISGPANINLI